MMRKIIVVLLLVVLVGCGNNSPTGPSEILAANATAKVDSDRAEVSPTPTLRFSPEQTTVRIGSEVVVETVVENAYDVHGIATTIRFDSSKLRLVKIEEGGFLKQQNPTYLMYAISDARSDNLVIGLSSLGRVPGVNGSGMLFRIVFRATNKGQTKLEFVETALVSPTLEKTFPQLQSATITIE